MGYGMIIFVLTGALVSVASAQSRQFSLVDGVRLNWTEAQAFCRDSFTDLATIESRVDTSFILRSTNFTGKAWIGLHDDLINSWRWSLNDSTFYADGETEFRNWFRGQPNNLGGQQHCVALFPQSPFFGEWGDQPCSDFHLSVCYNGTINGIATFVKVNTFMNWTDAQKFCRTNYVDLASIRNITENADITKLAAFNFVWIGLHREKEWSDGSTSLFRDWASGQPDKASEECASFNFTDSGRWSDDNCALLLNVICYRTTPPNAENFTSVSQLETSITLQWNKVNDNVSFILEIDGAQRKAVEADGEGTVTFTLSNLTAATTHTFLLFSVLQGVLSSGVNLSAVTAPLNTDSFQAATQDETSITLQWNAVTNNSFILRFNGTYVHISAPDINGTINYTVSNLTAGTLYTFTLFTVFEEIFSSGVSIKAATAPSNADSLISLRQDESSITLQWSKVSNNSFILQFDGVQTLIPAPDGNGPVNYTVSNLTAGTLYIFTLFTVFENITSSGVNVTAATAPSNADSLISLRQDESSITLQWSKVSNSSFILQFDGVQTLIPAPDGNGPVNYTVSNLTAGILYTFTLFTVFENITSSGVNVTAATAPLNSDSFQAATQDETSITLQWNAVTNKSFILRFNGTYIRIPAPEGHGPVNYTVSSLTAGTLYTFTLFTVFENITSTGVNVTTATGEM
ncbi:receptor-type tyrosine-protein phosphatase H-like isoform X2 [Nelusetta ayraudi]|uniref:receptor-type tyrosine-protein phosphatase H-like isoform X2 n=1 Tax=Nelusetta ayraudi TaxID=303726 RepID=UPI003F70CF02